MEFLPAKTETTSSKWAAFAGCLKGDPSFVGDALEIQRNMRDEW